jgi:hypothetical protein
VVADARINFERNGLPEIRSRVGILRARSAMRADERDVPFYVAKPFWGSRLNASVSESNVIRVDSVPVYCLEDEIRAHGATALICDIEGGEAELLSQADLRGIRKIVIETHYWAAGKAAVDAMMRKLIMDGFSLDLDLSAHHFSVLTR